MRIRATDRDSGPGGRLSYSVVGIAGATYANNSDKYNCVNGSHGVFTIGEITGVITTAEHLASVCLYTISVRARDHGIPSLWSQTTVRVQTTFKNYTIVKYPPVIAFLSEAGKLNLFCFTGSKIQIIKYIYSFIYLFTDSVRNTGFIKQKDTSPLQGFITGHPAPVK